jgi:hypothetical protein
MLAGSKLPGLMPCRRPGEVTLEPRRERLVAIAHPAYRPELAAAPLIRA